MFDKIKVHRDIGLDPCTEVVLRYDLCNKPVTLITHRENGVNLIAVRARSGDRYLLVWDPSPKDQKGEVWVHEFHSKYDTNHIIVGIFQGALKDAKAKHGLLDLLSEAIDVVNPAVTPRDVDGFIQLRPRVGVNFRSEYETKFRGTARFSESPDSKHWIKKDNHKQNTCLAKVIVHDESQDDPNIRELTRYIEDLGHKTDVTYSVSDLNAALNEYLYDDDGLYLAESSIVDLCDAIGGQMDIPMERLTSLVPTSRGEQKLIHEWLCNGWTLEASHYATMGYHGRNFNGIRVV